MSMSSIMDSLVPAYIEILPPGIGTVKFQFNPLEYSVGKSANWVSSPQKGEENGGAPEFQGSMARHFDVTIFFDATLLKNDVQVNIDLLFSTCDPSQESIAQGNPEPPHVLFGWGTNRGFESFMRTIEVTYKLFRATGEVLRAEANISMEEIPTSLPPTNPSSGGLAARRTHTLLAGENLALVAHKAYGAPVFWRALAAVNGIDDPMRVPVGTVLLVPDRGEIKGLS